MIKYPSLEHSEKHQYKHNKIEVWYDDERYFFPWQAFCSGIGTKSGAEKEEALINIKKEIDKSNK